MSNFKGTKGNWKFYHELNDNKIISRDHQYIVCTQNGQGLFVTSYNSNPHEKSANAQLIACAPEMLDQHEKELVFLKEVLKQLDEFGGSLSKDLQDMIGDKEQLIKKATTI